MSEKASEKSESRSRVMSALDEASSLVRQLAEPRPADDSVRAAILRSARQLRGWSASRVKDIWYRDPRARVSGDELNELRRISRQQEQEAKARDELTDAVELLVAIAARLDALVPDGARAVPDLARGAAGEEIIEARDASAHYRALDSDLRQG